MTARERVVSDLRGEVAYLLGAAKRWALALGTTLVIFFVAAALFVAVFHEADPGDAQGAALLWFGVVLYVCHLVGRAILRG